MLEDLARIHYRPEMRGARMILGFSGWMDGGDVSTGTVEYLVDALDARELAAIAPGPFYIYNFPGSMEISSLFRPHTRIEDGLVTGYEEPANRFYCSEEANLVLFEGKEPNLHWGEFAECLFSLAAEFGVTMLHFVGSVAGAVPHTKAPRFFGAVSEERFLPMLREHGLHPSSYEGPASFVTYLMTCAQNREVPMTSLVAEIPAYLQGRNTRCIEAATRKMAAILGLSISFDGLEGMSAEFEARLDEAVRERPELAELVRKMEEDYDKEVREAEMPGLRDWFEKQDIRLD